MAKGARRQKSPLQAALDTFNRVELVYYWKGGRDVQSLGEAALLDGFPGIRASLEKTVFGAFSLELAYKVAHENEPSGPLYAALAQGLTGMESWPGNVRAYTCWHAMQLLVAAGFEPTLDQCAECGRPFATDGGAVPAGFSYHGGVTCRHCRADRPLAGEEYETLQCLIGSRIECPAEAAKTDVYSIVRHYAARQLETDFRSVRVIEQMLGGTRQDV